MKIYPANVVASITTIRLLCPFEEMRECILYLVGEDISTIALASEEFVNKLRAGVFKQHPSLREIDEKAITPNNWEYHRDKIISQYGNLELIPFTNEVNESHD